MNVKNRTVFSNDNLLILRGLDTESVDLIYLDPPFNSNRNYAAPIGSQAAGAAFKDTWTLSDIDNAWHGEIADREPALYQAIHTAELTHSKGMKSYLIMMAVRLLEMKRVLKKTGSIYLHCDPTANHYLKVLMDSVFGKDNFRDEIVWQRASGRAKGSQHKSRSLGRDTDNIFHYSKSKDFIHNTVSQPLTESEILVKFPHTDSSGRRYNTGTPLFCQPSMGERPNLCYEYKGVKNPHPSGWRVKKEKLIEMDKVGDIIWREGKRPLRKSYADQYRGKPIGNLWIDIPIAAGKERTGYPTQKPVALLERIIKASSNKDDIVLDPFCGCATTCVAAERLGRQWIGIDISPKAVDLVRVRLKNEVGLFGEVIHRTDIPKRSEKLPNYRTHKHTLYGKQEGLCNGCETQFPFRNMTLDHIVPKSQGGTDHEENLQLLCGACNSTKGNRTQAELIARLKQQGIIKS